MATLTLPPANAAGQASTQEGLAEGIRKPLEDTANPGDMDSEWVVLGKSEIVPADLATAAAAAATAGRHRLNFSPLPMIPIWVQMILGGVVYTAIPFYKRARKVEGETIANVETAVEVVEHVAEVIEKLAANAADSLPENGPFQKVAVEIECIAEVVDIRMHKR
ncbi:hypothetical protein BS78_02G211100 [Paspalum vaginatum]|nr:hypothetical protein BS78_02G211100 [Paspalum vaginatum]